MAWRRRDLGIMGGGGCDITPGGRNLLRVICKRGMLNGCSDLVGVRSLVQVGEVREMGDPREAGGHTPFGAVLRLGQAFENRSWGTCGIPRADGPQRLSPRAAPCTPHLELSGHK